MDASVLEDRTLYSASPLAAHLTTESMIIEPTDVAADESNIAIHEGLAADIKLQLEVGQLDTFDLDYMDLTIHHEMSAAAHPELEVTPVNESRMNELELQSFPRLGSLADLNDHRAASSTPSFDSPLPGMSSINDVDNHAILISHIDTLTLHADLDRMTESIGGNGLSAATMLGTTMATAAIAVGYVIWTSRTNYLISSLLAVTPAWTDVDPLPILEFAEADQDIEGGDRPIVDLVRLFDRTI